MTRQFGLTSSTMGDSRDAIMATSPLPAHEARSTPRAAAIAVDTSDSVKSCRTSRRAAGTDRQPHRDFALARDAASQQQIGGAGARDGKQQPDQREQDPAEVRRTVVGRGRSRPTPARAPSVWPRYFARRSAGIPGFVVTSSTAGQMRCSATFACWWLSPSRSRPMRCSHELVVEVSARCVLTCW